jgi:HSP20 family protein
MIMARTFGAFLEAARIQSEINRLFDNLLDLGGEGKEGGAWIPNADIVETEDYLLVKAELPGVAPEGLSISVLGGNLILQGEKARTEPEARSKFHLAERAFGRFRRVIHLGVPVNTHRAEAELKDGLLKVRFPKVPNRRGEEVAIEVKTS